MIPTRLKSLVVLPALAGAALFAAGTAPASANPVPSAPAVTCDCAGLPGNVSAFLRAYRAWGAAPTVEAYLDLFTPDATLMDSGLAAPIDMPRIQAQIEGVLRVVPDYRFTPVTATSTADGQVVFIEAVNTGTVNGQQISFTTMHRLVMSGDKVRQGRRFWDQVELFRPVAPDLPALFDGLTTDPARPAAAPASTSGDRQRAWNTEDSTALVAALPGSVTLSGTGLAAPLTGRDAATAYLNRMFGAVDHLDLRPGHRVARGDTGYQEWVGTAVVGGAQPRTIQFGVVERLVRDPGAGVRWSLHFDTLDMVATPERIAELRALIFG